MEDSEEKELAEKFASAWIEDANQGEMVEISDWQKTSAVMTAALEILVRALQDGTNRGVEKLFIRSMFDERGAPSLQNLFRNCPNLRQVRLVHGHVGYRVFMEAINEGMCPNVKILRVLVDMYVSKVSLLVGAIDNGKLKSLETLDVTDSRITIVNAIVSALSTGQCPNLKKLIINDGECDASVAEKFVDALANQQIPRLRAVSRELFDPKELSDRSKWEAAESVLVKNLSAFWIEESRRGTKELRIDGEANHSSVIASALELFGRACQDGMCRSLERLVLADVEDESAATSLWIIFRNCPNLRKVELESAKVACRVLLEAVNEGKCPELENLSFGDFFDRIDYPDATALARAIENDNLKNLRTLKVGRLSGDGPQSISDAIVLALTNGECPNLESVTISTECNASNAKKFVHAIADEKFPKLKEVNKELMELHDYLSVLQVPEEFTDKDNETILSYLREGWEHGTEPLSVVKVVITGPGSVGKTCLVNRLVKDVFPEDATTTIGVDVTRKVQDNGLELVYYDFGGQPVYATTHQLFLRTRAVFLIAWQVPSETTNFENHPCHQHAQDLFDVSPEAQIIFVTTKSDRCSRLSQEEQTKLKEMYKGHFQGYFHVSAKTEADEGTDNLKNSICALADTVLHSIGGKHGLAGVKIPKPYVELKRLLASLRDEGTKFYLTTDDWKELAEKVGIVERERVESVLSLFHEMGEVLRLPTGQIIIDPPKLSDVLARVVTNDDRYKQNARGGYLRHNELDTVWDTYDKELHQGFLQLLHECEVGYPIHGDDGEYEATLIPAMLDDESETMQTHIEKLRSDHSELQAGPRIVVELSTRSGRFGQKFLLKLRSITGLGGWWQNGCIVVDNTERSGEVRSFGTVSWNVGTGTVVTILMYGDIRPLRRQVLEVLGSCLEDFSGTELIGLTLEFSSGPDWHGSWAKDVIACTSVDPNPEQLMALVHKDCDDVANWIETSRASRNLRSGERSFASLEYLQRRLMKDSGASGIELSHLLLVHQKDLLCLGHPEQGRDKLNALWLIFEFGRLWFGTRRYAFPLRPHRNPESISVNEDLGVSGTFRGNLSHWKPLQARLNKVVQSVLENSRLDIPAPLDGAEFKGILWNGIGEVKQKTRRNFKEVIVPEIGAIWVHKDDVADFQDPRQPKASEGLAKKVAESIKAHPDLPAYINNPHELKDSGQAKVYHGTMAGKNGSPEEVAVKVFKKESDWDACREEVKLLWHSSGHPNVMRVLAAFEVPLAPKPCFVMRFIPGGSLRDHLNKPDEKFVYDKAIELLKGIGEGLRHLHSLKIVHRDLKSPNILLESVGDSLRPVLIDLGLGKRIEDSNQTHWHSTGDKGTLLWMAPEMMEHAIWNKKTDMYALGIIMWEVLTGKMPYADKTPVQIYKFVMDGGRLDTVELMKKAGLSQAHVNLIESLWHQEPSQRPTVEEFLKLLDGTSASPYLSQHKLVDDAKCLVIVVIFLAVVWLLLL